MTAITPSNARTKAVPDTDKTESDPADTVPLPAYNSDGVTVATVAITENRATRRDKLSAMHLKNLPI
jgi:hypothetical protein